MKAGSFGGVTAGLKPCPSNRVTSSSFVVLRSYNPTLNPATLKKPHLMICYAPQLIL